MVEFHTLDFTLQPWFVFSSTVQDRLFLIDNLDVVRSAHAHKQPQRQELGRSTFVSYLQANYLFHLDWEWRMVFTATAWHSHHSGVHWLTVQSSVTTEIFNENFGLDLLVEKPHHGWPLTFTSFLKYFQTACNSGFWSYSVGEPVRAVWEITEQGDHTSNTNDTRSEVV